MSKDSISEVTSSPVLLFRGHHLCNPALLVSLGVATVATPLGLGPSLGSTLTASFDLNFPFKCPVPYLDTQEVETPTDEFGENTIQSITVLDEAQVGPKDSSRMHVLVLEM